MARKEDEVRNLNPVQMFEPGAAAIDLNPLLNTSDRPVVGSGDGTEPAPDTDHALPPKGPYMKGGVVLWPGDEGYPVDPNEEPTDAELRAIEAAPERDPYACTKCDQPLFSHARQHPEGQIVDHDFTLVTAFEVADPGTTGEGQNDDNGQGAPSVESGGSDQPPAPVDPTPAVPEGKGSGTPARK